MSHWTDRYHKGEWAYMPGMDFNPDDPNPMYAVTVTLESGVTVYSECCLDTVSLVTAKVLHEALGQWIADQEEDA